LAKETGTICDRAATASDLTFVDGVPLVYFSKKVSYQLSGYNQECAMLITEAMQIFPLE
jgi:hypothetical protein